MKAVTNEETRKKLKEHIWSAVCIQLALWWACFAIEDLLDQECDAITRIFQVGRYYSERKVRELQVEEIVFGREAETSARVAGGTRKIRSLKPLSKALRRKLLHATQNAIWLQNAFLNEAESIAEMRNCDLDIVLDFLSILTEGSHPGLEIPEIQWAWFFGNIRSEGETSDQTFMKTHESAVTESHEFVEGKKV